MEIRSGRPDDIKEIVSKYPYTRQVISDDGYSIVAISKNTILGFAYIFRREIPCPVEQQEDFINVIEVFNETERNKGIASSIIDECKKIAKQRGSYQVRAYCDLNNVASHHLWKKNGFGISPVKNQDGSICGSYVTYVL